MYKNKIHSEQVQLIWFLSSDYVHVFNRTFGLHQFDVCKLDSSKNQI